MLKTGKSVKIELGRQNRAAKKTIQKVSLPVHDAT
jgi:hypothetical protein